MEQDCPGYRSGNWLLNYDIPQQHTILQILPVQDAQTKISNQKNQDLMPDQLIDTALPPQQEVPNAM